MLLCARSSDWKGKGGDATPGVLLQVKHRGIVPADKASPLLKVGQIGTRYHPAIKRNRAWETAGCERLFTATLKNFN